MTKPKFSESFDTKIVKDVASEHDYARGVTSAKSVRFDDSAEDYSKKPR